MAEGALPASGASAVICAAETVTTWEGAGGSGSNIDLTANTAVGTARITAAATAMAVSLFFHWLIYFAS